MWKKALKGAAIGLLVGTVVVLAILALVSVARFMSENLTPGQSAASVFLLGCTVAGALASVIPPTSSIGPG